MGSKTVVLILRFLQRLIRAGYFVIKMSELFSEFSTTYCAMSANEVGYVIGSAISNFRRLLRRREKSQ